MTRNERAVLERMRADLIALADAPHAGTMTDYWRDRQRAMAEMARTKPLEEFLSWSVDLHYHDEVFFRRWYEDLVTRPDWKARWEPLSRALPWGKPHAFPPDAGTTPVTLQHAYHLMRYETTQRCRFVADLDLVVEVGGGYGNFARMLRTDGFSGEYVVVDLPVTQVFQRAYLALSNVAARLVTEDRLDTVDVAGRRVGFVSTFALSETPLAFRAKVRPLLDAASKVLLAVQWPSHKMENDVSNEIYFGDVARSSRLTFWAEPIAHFPGHMYLFAGGATEDKSEAVERRSTMTTREEQLKAELRAIEKTSKVLDAVVDTEVRARVATYLAEKYAPKAGSKTP